MHLKESLSFTSLIVYASLNLSLKILIQIIIGTSLQKFPHFQTSLSSLSSIKESIHSHNSNGAYYSDPKSVNQSIFVIKLFDFVLTNFKFGSEENTIFVFFCIIDICIMVMQLMIIDMVWTRKKWVKEYEVMVMMLVVFFSPMQISSIPAQNTGAVKDLFTYICMWAFLQPQNQELSQFK